MRQTKEHEKQFRKMTKKKQLNDIAIDKVNYISYCKYKKDRIKIL